MTSAYLVRYELMHEEPIYFVGSRYPMLSVCSKVVTRYNKKGSNPKTKGLNAWCKT